jgi:hypothetical protein
VGRSCCHFDLDPEQEEEWYLSFRFLNIVRQRDPVRNSPERSRATEGPVAPRARVPSHGESEYLRRQGPGPEAMEELLAEDASRIENFRSTLPFQRAF